MLDLARNFDRFSMLGANALLILALAAVSVACDTRISRAPAAAVPADWHAPLAIVGSGAPGETTRYVPDWTSRGDRSASR